MAAAAVGDTGCELDLPAARDRRHESIRAPHWRPAPASRAACAGVASNRCRSDTTRPGKGWYVSATHPRPEPRPRPASGWPADGNAPTHPGPRAAAGRGWHLADARRFVATFDDHNGAPGARQRGHRAATPDRLRARRRRGQTVTGRSEAFIYDMSVVTDRFRNDKPELRPLFDHVDVSHSADARLRRVRRRGRRLDAEGHQSAPCKIVRSEVGLPWRTSCARARVDPKGRLPSTSPRRPDAASIPGSPPTLSAARSGAVADRLRRGSQAASAPARHPASRRRTRPGPTPIRAYCCR